MNSHSFFLGQSNLPIQFFAELSRVTPLLFFLLLSFPRCAQTETGAGFSSASCDQLSGFGMTIPFNKNTGTFLPQCAPDTLYNWMKPEYVEKHVQSKESGRQQCLKVYGAHFAWRTPLGSHGYGRDSIRIKLKSDTKFFLIDDLQRECDYLKAQYPEIYKKTVWAAHHVGLNGYHEYLICSMNVVDSWSTGTSEHLLEMENEAAWIKKEIRNGTSHYDKLNRSIKHLAYEGAIDSIDNVDWSEASLEKAFELHREKIKTKRDRLFSCTKQPPDRNFHFSTNHPNYFNARVTVSRSDKK
jgi:hypothetical protein